MKMMISTLLIAGACSCAAQKLEVKIINRQESETDRSYMVAGQYTSQSTSAANCNVNSSDVNCNGSSHTYGYETPAYQVPFHVRGATFSLLLPDGRVAVVNCESKFAERMAGAQGNRRSCRIPLVDTLQVEFHGDKAKLEWTVSIDGKKMQSETYKVIGVLDKPTEDAK